MPAIDSVRRRQLDNNRIAHPAALAGMELTALTRILQVLEIGARSIIEAAKRPLLGRDKDMSGLNDPIAVR